MANAHKDCTGTTRVSLKWLKTAGLEVSKDLIESYNPKLRYITYNFFPTHEVAQSLPVPGGYENRPVFMVYVNPPRKEGNVGFIFLRHENNSSMRSNVPWNSSPYANCCPQYHWYLFLMEGPRSRNTLKTSSAVWSDCRMCLNGLCRLQQFL